MDAVLPYWIDAPQAGYVLAAYGLGVVALGALYFSSRHDHKKKLIQWNLVSREDADNKK